MVTSPQKAAESRPYVGSIEGRALEMVEGEQTFIHGVSTALNAMAKLGRCPQCLSDATSFREAWLIWRGFS